MKPIHNLKKAVQRGFTLIELVVVLAVIAILAVAGIAAINNNVERAQISDTVTFIERELLTAFVGCFQKTRDYQVCLRDAGDATEADSTLLREGAPNLTSFETEWTVSAPDAAGAGAATVLTIPVPNDDVGADLVTRLSASQASHLDNPANVGFDTDAASDEGDLTVTLYLP